MTRLFRPFRAATGLFRIAILLAAASLGIAASLRAANELAIARDVEVDRLGPGNISFPLLGTAIVGDTIYVGSRNLTPSRVAGFHLPTGRVISEFILGNGAFVQSIVYDGNTSLYAGVTQAQSKTNLYRIDLASGEVSEAAAVPGQSVAVLALAPDGIIYTTGRPEGRRLGPALFSFDPATGKLTKVAVPNPDAGQALGLAVTESTVYFGSGASSVAGGRAGLASIDRATGEIADILPPRLARHKQINQVKVFDDVLVVGSQNVGVMNIATGEWRIADIGTRKHQFARDGDTLFAATSRGLHEIDLTTWRVTPLSNPGKGMGDYQSLEIRDNFLVGTMSGGHIWTFDRSSSEDRTYDLIEAGASGDGEAGQSIRVLGDKVYVGGNNSVAVHDLNGGPIKTLPIPGEVKAMVAVDDTMYMATYGPAALWEHRPAVDESLRRIGGLSANRPRDMAWDDVNKRVVIGIRSDRGGGSLEFYDPETETFTAHRNPIGDDQWVSAVAPSGGIVYLAGCNRAGQAGNISAWDPVANKEIWRVRNPMGENGGVSTLTVVDNRLFGIAIGGARLFVIDIGARNAPKTIHVGDLSELISGNTPLPRLHLARGILYGVSDQTVFRIDPDTFEATLLVGNLNADWFSGPQIDIGEDRTLYTFAGRHLIRIRDNSFR